MNIQSAHVQESASPAAARAGGSSFYFAMRILGREQREAMFEIYSFCRAVDDIADGNAPREQRMAELAGWRRDLDALYSGAVPAGFETLARVIARFGLRKEDFLAVIDGMEMDAKADIRAPHMDELDLYCDRVASAVGRLSVRVFGMEEDDGRALAHHLGRALQLTNILRDLDEDAGIGRLYLPREALDAAGIAGNDPFTVLKDPRLDAACRFVAERARGHFVEANAIMSRCRRRVVRAPRIMGEVYSRMLADMVAHGWLPPRRRIHVNKSYLIWIALRHAFI
ncbi:MAG TPA: presqualene diphosphate synthase HpnD [Pseudolabrys sp.]|nr:presqualene diphosphate synthase HpnD [Pseudolabrys sp.]